MLAVVVGRPGVISARYRTGAQTRRASGRIADVLAEVLPASLQGSSLDVVGAPKDVLDALAERDIIVRPAEPAHHARRGRRRACGVGAHAGRQPARSARRLRRASRRKSPEILEPVRP